LTQITCETGAASSESSTGTAQAGANSIKRRIYNNTVNGVMKESDLLTYSYTDLLNTNLEGPSYQGDYYGNVFSGYFKAPATTNYKFYSSCDDKCTVKLSTANLDPT
jgi:hypothetical protein